MTRPRLMFVVQESLGWSTYLGQLRRVVERRPDIEPVVLPFRFPRIARLLFRRNNLGPLGRAVRLWDPISAMRGTVGRQVRRSVLGAAPCSVHLAGQWPAAAIAWQPGVPPFTVALDHTRAGIERELPRGAWTTKAMEREAELLLQARRLYPMSRWAAASLIGDCRVAADKVTVMPPSLDLRRFVPWRGGGRLPRILFVGNDFIRKGGDRLVGWVTGALAGSCELHIVSADPAAALANRRGVIPHGRVRNDVLVGELIPSMDIFCLPTLSDMSPQVLAEAAAGGLPSVASRIAGIPDLVMDGETGLLVPPQDDAGFVSALMRLVASPELRAEMGRAAVVHAQGHFDADRNFSLLVEGMLRTP